MDIHERFVLQDCPHCGGAGMLEEEDCGCQTAPFEYRTPAEREKAAETAAMLWNVGKVIRQENGE